MAERVGFDAALILKAVGISLRKFSWLDGKSKAENGSRFGSRLKAESQPNEILLEGKNIRAQRSLSLKVKCHSSTDLPIFSSGSCPTSPGFLH
jgi:hypothetical protein